MLGDAVIVQLSKVQTGSSWEVYEQHLWILMRWWGRLLQVMRLFQQRFVGLPFSHVPQML